MKKTSILPELSPASYIPTTFAVWTTFTERLKTHCECSRWVRFGFSACVCVCVRHFLSYLFTFLINLALHCMCTMCTAHVCVCVCVCGHVPFKCQSCHLARGKNLFLYEEGKVTTRHVCIHAKEKKIAKNSCLDQLEMKQSSPKLMKSSHRSSNQIHCKCLTCLVNTILRKTTKEIVFCQFPVG